MQFEKSDILIKLSDGYIENILVYNDEDNYDNGEINQYYSIVMRTQFGSIIQKPTQPRSLPISIGGGIGEWRGKINVGYLF